MTDSASPAPKAKPIWLHPTAKPALFVACLLPLAWLFYRGFTDTLGANPAETVIRATGDWTLRLLCIVLVVTPLRVWTHQPLLIRFRRMLGLFSFFYGVLHFFAYAWLDMGLDLADIAADIPKRPFALVGFLALLLMLPLAATSFNRAMKAMGGQRWRMVHRLLYAAILLGLLHFFWMRAAKNDFAEVAVYSVVVAFLLSWRLWHRLRKAAT